MLSAKNNEQFEQKSHLLPLWLPMRRYQVTIKHVLLSRLGGISHFAIAALDKNSGGYEAFYRITGLSPAQASPLLKRLSGLKLINGDGLTENGKRLASILSELHNKSVFIWIDLVQMGPPIMASDDVLLQAIEEMPDTTAITIRGKARQRPDTDLQRIRLQRYFANYLDQIFPKCKSLSSNEKGGLDKEWEVELANDPKYQENGLPILQPLMANTCYKQTTKDSAVLTVQHPVLCLTTDYSTPAGLPPQFEVTQLPTQVFSLCLATMEQPEELLEKTNPGHPEWPQICDDNQNTAATILLQVLAAEARQVPKYLNVTNRFDFSWRTTSLTWQMIQKTCATKDGVTTWIRQP